jgi:hypothetical protein
MERIRHPNDALVEAIKRRQQIAALPSLPLAAFSRNLFTVGKMWPFITPVIDWFVAQAEHSKPMIGALIEVFLKFIRD